MPQTAAAQTAAAIVPTENAKRYLGQLAKHFAHRIPVELDEHGETATMQFPFGHGVFKADAAALHVTVTSDSAEDLVKLEDAVARHLLRFAFREQLAVNWRRQG